MKTERTIRAQARESLKGNWTAAVSGVFVILVFILIFEVVFELLCLLTGVFEGEKIKSGCEVPLRIILCFVFLLTFAATPVKNGYYRLCYNIACGRSDGLRDVFYFFSGIKIYLKTLKFNLIILLYKALYFIISFIPYFALAAIKAIINNPSADYKNFIDICDTVILCFCVTLFILITVRLVIPEFVFTDNCEADVFTISKSISKNHLGDYYKLIFTFLPWLLSCLFVIPGLYVIPYFTTSLGTTSKWLINIYKEGKTV